MAGALQTLGGAYGAFDAPAPRALNLRPPWLALSLAGAALGAHAALFGLQAPWGSSPLAGGALLAAGLGWMAWAAFTLRRARTTLRPGGRPTRLVDEGPFRFGRNPIYLGLAAALLGLGLALGVAFMLPATAAFVAVLRRVHIPFEEAALKRAFGGWYSDYAADVRRWF